MIREDTSSFWGQRSKQNHEISDTLIFKQGMETLGGVSRVCLVGSKGLVIIELISLNFMFLA